MTDSQGQAVWQWSYSAFGDEKPTIAKNRFANLDISPNPGTTSFAEVTLNKRYDGQYYDKESGLHYNNFRTYCPTCGRYTQPDPKGLGGGWNRIGYVDGDPVNFRDPWGLDRWGSYGYGRYIPSTNPSPTFWEKLNFPETPEQRELGYNIALGFCGSTIGGAAKGIKAGSFSITDWAGYPAGVPKPQGPFRLLEGAEYNAARDAANAANGAIRRDEGLVGKALDVHEVQPVKFGGSPTDPGNKLVLPRDVHRQQVTPWWNQLMRDIARP